MAATSPTWPLLAHIWRMNGEEGQSCWKQAQQQQHSQWNHSFSSQCRQIVGGGTQKDVLPRKK
jgi:hypothetical protein